MNRMTAFAAAISLAAGFATSASADTYDTCRMAGSVAGLAMLQRANGASQYEAADTAGAIISQVVNDSPAPYGTRIIIADRLASVSTYLIQMVYSLPLDRSVPAYMLSDIAESVVFDLCLSGEI